MRDFYIEPSTSNERKELFLETLLNNTSKVSKVSDHSVINGLAYGIAKIAGKSEKDIAVYFSRLHPDYASGIDLDNTAKLLGITSRFQASESSVFLRITATPGTVYSLGTLEFKSDSGINFFIDKPFTVSSQGFIYVMARSFDKGEIANVQASTVKTAVSPPLGHLSVINETKGFGAKDEESDESLRKRIKESSNVLAKSTLSTIEQIMLQVNQNVFKVYNYGTNSIGKTELAVMSQNGAFFTQEELNLLRDACLEYLTLSDLSSWTKKVNIINVVNVQVFPIDISLRCELDGTTSLEFVRQQMQTKILSYLDPTNFLANNKKIEWDRLLELCRNVIGVKYLADEFFYPRIDIRIPERQIVRLRGFRILNLKGSVMNDSGQDLSSYSYPLKADFNYINKVLTT